MINGIHIPKPKSKTKINNKESNNNQDQIDLSIKVPSMEYQDDDYEKILEKEIEEQCQFKVYIDKLELDNKTDDELLSLNKEDILSFKNNQIAKLKAYIASLEQEKDDLIDNFKETTSLLLERIKDIEFQSKGIRPETPMITKNLAKKKGGIVQGDFKSLQAKKTLERCPNCHLEFPEEQFVAHSLQCLRKAFNCKVCNELVHESKKMEHLNKYRSPQAMLKAITDNDEKAFQLGIDHGFQINSVINKDTEEAVIHLIAKTNNTALMTIVFKHKSVNINLLNKSKDTPLIIAIDHKCEPMILFLLDKRVDFKLRNKGDMSPLMLCCKYGLETVFYRLVNLGVDINERNILGDTPLAIAQRYKQDGLEAFLLPNMTSNNKLKKKNI